MSLQEHLTMPAWNLEFHAVEVLFWAAGAGGHNERSRERPILILGCEEVSPNKNKHKIESVKDLDRENRTPVVGTYLCSL